MTLRQHLQTLPKIPTYVWLLWILAACAIPVWISQAPAGWDVGVYATAMNSLRAGHDPYLDATDIQKRHHADLVRLGKVGHDDDPPYSYVYAPITLPLLRIANHLPRLLLALFYWILYATGTLAAIAIILRFAQRGEFPAMWIAAGLAPFFPGLLANGTILSGNIAYILYGTALTAAALAWSGGTWWIFYVVVLIAACVKAPLLSLALIAPLSGRKQWLPACITIAAGSVLFLSQTLIWPQLFRHYLEAVELQFSFNHDFGCSPAGLFSSLLYRHGIPYSPASYVVYAGYALPVFAALVLLSRSYLAGRFTLQQWAPVLLTGTILLNPRIMEYDAAPITVPMALITWRLATATRSPRLCLAIGGTLLLLMNAASIYSWELRKDLDAVLITVLFAAGAVQLWRSRDSVSAPIVPCESS